MLDLVFLLDIWVKFVLSMSLLQREISGDLDLVLKNIDSCYQKIKLCLPFHLCHFFIFLLKYVPFFIFSFPIFLFYHCCQVFLVYVLLKLKFFLGYDIKAMLFTYHNDQVNFIIKLYFVSIHTLCNVRDEFCHI